MADKLLRAYEIFQREGMTTLSKKSIAHFYRTVLRDILPKRQQIVKYSGVKTPVQVGILDKYIPEYSPPWYCSDIPDYEAEEVRAIREYTKRGDDILIIGGGFGITPVVAAECVGNSSSVTAYEGSFEAFKQACKTVKYNGLEDIVKIHHAIVGQAIDLKGPPNGAKIVAPSDLPDADLIEMDCEGAEIKILQEMEIQPRVILVESHKKYGSPKEDVVRLLKEKGYEIKKVQNKTADGQHHITATLNGE